ncbi:MAG: hypothetical protein KDD48_07705 [Bdellovibrionales bacterium]|nr:hypothetical protein [Bdellovibrionales bacterium]
MIDWYHPRRKTTLFSRSILYLLTIPAIFCTHHPIFLICLLVLFVSLKYYINEETHDLGRMALWILCFVIFRSLLVHRGSMVLIDIPSHIPFIGGRVTLEGFVSSVIIGFQLYLVLTWVLLGQKLLSLLEWVRLFPKKLRDVSLVLVVSIKMIPKLRRSYHQIKEAHQGRGYSFGGLRSYLPLMTTWVHQAIESSYSLAETLDIRGYTKNASASTISMEPKALLVFLFFVIFFMAQSYFYYDPFKEFWMFPRWPALGLMLGFCFITFQCFKSCLFKPLR